MSQMPSLGPTVRRRSRAVAILPLSALALAAGFAVWSLQSCRPKPPAVVDAGPPVAQAPPPPPPTPAEQMAKEGFKHAHVAIEGPLERAVIDAAGPTVGPSLDQVVTRALVWWMEVPGDFRKGDQLDILYEERANQEPVVHAVRYASTKLDKTFSAYRFKAAGDSFARLYQPGGDELELRLKDAPLEDYEQVTSHLRDGRHHKGVDFKTPLGSKVHAPFAGTVTRKTWNFRSNGNSLEIADGKGTKVLLLHLSEIPQATHVGSKIAKGEVVGESGNTGHSFAPHLHYQLMQGERLLDPFKVQETYRKSLAADQRVAFDAQVHKLDAWMGLTGAKADLSAR